ncbi:MAG: hypothetical protein ACFFD1_11305, partial [Candidatus Thorarchaeota archaeon]
MIEAISVIKSNLRYIFHTNNSEELDDLLFSGLLLKIIKICNTKKNKREISQLVSNNRTFYFANSSDIIYLISTKDNTDLEEIELIIESFLKAKNFFILKKSLNRMMANLDRKLNEFCLKNFHKLIISINDFPELRLT